LGAQINAFSVENYKPLVDGLGTYLSQMYTEHGTGEAARPSADDETAPLQQSPGTTTTTASGTQHKNKWLNKLWPSKNTSTNEQEENNA
jgi:hypothetical protein